MENMEHGMDKDYKEEGFWGKIKDYGKKAGSEVVEKALQLYYAAQGKDTPVWAKTTIYGSLAYFISPVDAIPDVLLGVGYADDLGVLLAAIGVVSAYINDDVRQKAKEQLTQWFG